MTGELVDRCVGDLLDELEELAWRPLVMSCFGTPGLPDDVERRMEAIREELDRRGVDVPAWGRSPGG